MIHLYVVKMYESKMFDEVEKGPLQVGVNSIPDFIKNDKVDDALKNVFRQEIQIYMYTQRDQYEKKSILSFPALLTSRSRFILHTIVAGEFSRLATFSVGEEPNRRCYVTNKDLFASLNR